MAQQKTLKQILALLPELVRDVSDCEKSLDEDKQYLRRSYVRSLFAMIEGTIHCVKELEFAELYAHKKTSIPTLVALKEKMFDIDEKGKIKENTKFVKSVNNLRFMVNTFDRLYGKKLDLGIGKSIWTSFKSAIKIRNRITHPKEPGDLNISDRELAIAKNVNEWFNVIVKDIIEHISDFYK